MRNKDVNTLILEKIGSNIRKERLAKNITLKDLSDKLNMSYATVQKYEIGKIEPSIIMLFDIAEALNVNISQILKIDIELDISESELKQNINYIKNILEQILTYNEVLNLTKYKQFLNKDIVEKLNYILAPINSEVIFDENIKKLKTKNTIYNISDYQINELYKEIINFMEFKLLKYEQNKG